MSFDWFVGQDLDRLPLYLTALAIGLLIGLDRERNPTAKAGLRTCALVALGGALSADLAQTFSASSIIAVGLGGVALMMITAYYHHHEDFHEWDPGTTTIAAVMACYLLGALTVAGSARLAVILGVLTTMLLYFKAELGGGARKLERHELVSILQFAVVAFVVLPLLPDRNFGPYGALNPRHIWLMVVLISGVSLTGYIALRIVGGRHGGWLLGLFGGLVSSTATTLAYARRARDVPEALGVATTVVVTANIVLLARLLVLASIVSPDILAALSPVLGTSFIAGAGVFALVVGRQRSDSELAPPSVRNPTELRSALAFAALYAAVLLLSAWLGDVWGREGAYAVALTSGFVDVDAIALGNLRLYGLGQISDLDAIASIVIALSANAMFKLSIVRFAGGSALFMRCLPPVGATVLGAAVALGFLW
ncbi:MAG TPA: DUF4010 domain-containing protein [Burkholderiales bacterium]|nr:DUF4010 domain-containing protein [Burkholderiales bacterium]